MGSYHSAKKQLVYSTGPGDWATYMLGKMLKLLGSVKNFAMFWYMLVCGAYITEPKQFKVLGVVSSNMIVGVLTCILLYSMDDLKAAQMNMQLNPIGKLCFISSNSVIMLQK